MFLSMLLLAGPSLAATPTDADPPSDADLPSFTKVENLALAGRLEILSGEVLLEFRERRTRDPESVPDRTSSALLRFDGTAVYSDVGPTAGGVRLAGMRQQRIVHPGDDYVVAFFGAGRVGGGRGSSHVRAAPLTGSINPLFARRYDPRLLGFAVGGGTSLYNKPLNVFVGDAPRANERVEAVAGSDGQVLYRLSYDRVAKGGRASYTVDPTRGWSVTSTRLETTHGGREMIWDNDIVPEAYGPVWYPREVAHREIIEGETLLEETITVVQATFNVPVPAATFRPEALDVPAGTELVSFVAAIPPGEYAADGFRPYPRGAKPRPKAAPEPDRSAVPDANADAHDEDEAVSPVGEPRADLDGRLAPAAAIASACLLGAFFVRRRRSRERA